MAEPRPPVLETRKRASAAQPPRWRLPEWWTNANHKWLKTAAVAAVLILVLVLGTFAYALVTLPDPSKLDIGAGSVRIEDRHGTLIEERNAEGARVNPVKLEQISPTLQNATIAVEDKNFYQHHGIDWGRVIKAGIIDTIARSPEQGAKARQVIVLDAMVRQQMITSDQATEAANAKLNFVFKESRSSQAPHFVDFVFEQLENLYGPSVVNRGGFVVKTTLDLNMQKAAEHAVQVGMQRLGPLGADNGDLLAMDPKTGEILAMVGSADFFNNSIQGQFNVVTGLRQPGSSFKPYVYEQAFKSRKMTMGNLLDDTSRHFAGGQFHDFDMRDMGIITAHKALVQSRNIPALETMQMTGIDDVNNLARDMGITTNLKSEVTTAIGSSEVRMLDHVVGYGVFATGGVRHDPVSILSITDRSGNTLDTPSPPKPKQVLTPQEAYLITYILKDYSSTWGLGWNRPFAGKSGTTNNFRDAWMMAYAPNLVVGAWVGHTA